VPDFSDPHAASSSTRPPAIASRFIAFAPTPAGFRLAVRGGSASSTPALPLAAVELVKFALDILAAVEAAPDLACGFAAAFVEEQQRALEALRLFAPDAIGQRHQARAVFRHAFAREQDRLVLG